MKDQFLFFYLQAWGGHISTARAIATYMQQYHSSTVDPVLVDGFEEANRLIKKIIIDGYKTSQTTGQRVYELLYRINKSWIVAKCSQVILSWFVEPYIKKLLRKHHPKHIVILHFFLVRPVMRVLKKLDINIPVTTIITDPFTLHPLRSLQKNMDYVVFSQRAKDVLLQRKIAPTHIYIAPVILKDQFSHPMLPADIAAKKHHLWFDIHKKIIFIMWAGDGIPKWEKILQELIDTKIDAQIMLVCGRNKNLYHHANNIAHANPTSTIKIFWFVDFMYDLINIADIIITKGWPATLMEILMMNKIPVINSYIREQEKGNMEFVVQNKVGIYEPNIQKMVAIVHTMLSSDLSLYHQNIQKLHLRNGTQEVAEYLLKK